MEKSNTEEFNYIIARFWDKEKSNRLGAYAYGRTVFWGTKKDAKEMLDFVNGREEEIYSIFKIDIGDNKI
jgi:hypothetical protein